jgi:hypothetical protein
MNCSTRFREFVWQQVGDPDGTTSCMADGKHLERGVVMRQLPIDDRVCKPSPDVANVDDPFTDHGPIAKVTSRVADTAAVKPCRLSCPPSRDEPAERPRFRPEPMLGNGTVGALVDLSMSGVRSALATAG